MKKIISLILVLVLGVFSVFGLSSCGNPNPEDTLVCGVTIVKNLNEKNADGTWTGFDTEFATEVAKLLGMKVKFVEITWEQKYNEVNSGAIDAIWNGFTANSADNGIDRSELVDFSYGYMLNQQCIVVKAENLEQFTSLDSLKNKTATAETGSAGQSFAEGIEGVTVTSVPTQQNTFMEVKSGAVQFAVVDIILAQNICGQGDYSDLVIVEDIELESEIYAVGFKKGSELTEKVNQAIKTLEENGKLEELAVKYGFENVVRVMETIE